jgi:hypothetical protein
VIAEELRWRLAEKFGWTLEQIDGLNLSDLHEYLQIEDGKAHVNDSILRK